MQPYLDALFAASPRIRVNLSSYTRPAVPVLRSVLMVVALFLAGCIVWDLVELWSVVGEVQELSRSTARLQEQDRRVLAEGVQDGWDLAPAANKLLPSEVSFVNRLVEKRTFSWTQFLSELEQTVPSGIGVQSIRLDPNSALIQLAGVAQTFEDVTAFLTILEDHAQFSEPVLKQHHDRDDGLVEFNLTLRYRNHVKPG